MKGNQQLPSSLKDQTIDKDIAIFRTSQWRGVYKDKMQCKDEEILRAFLIPIEDIIALYNFYREHTDLNITGVRGYIGHNPIGPVTPDMNVDLLLVPVTAEGKDVLEMPAELVLAGNPPSTIYDFSQPCPATCDLTSALYNALTP